MFIGNLIANIFGGLIVGFLSDKPSHIIVFSFFWTLINLFSLFTFQKKEFLKLV